MAGDNFVGIGGTNNFETTRKTVEGSEMEEKELLKIIEEATRDGRTRLKLASKGIKSLPAEIGQLTNLKKINLYKNQLTSVPKELGQLKNLEELELSGNQLTSVPKELGQLKNLEELELSGNQLTSVPVELCRLRNLTRLNLYDNQLRSVPKELGQLTNLTSLSLFKNKLTVLPAEIANLWNLTVLYVDNNQFSCFPESIEYLNNIERFSVDAEHVPTLVKRIEKFPKMKVLYLDQQRLVSLPVELYQLTNLTELYLSRNQLSSVPKELCQLTNLRTLDLEGNPLESPPPEVVKQGTKAVLAYLRELEKGEKERYEAKLLILGDGSEGKTCVSRALRGLPFKKNIRTEGVEVVQWKFENKKFAGDKEKEITLNVWDFEGQEINHQSHQFFLTGKSLYVLVINGRRQFKPERAEYWLDTIRARAPESRVILVASECENTTPSWPLDKLKQEYGDLLQGESWYFAVGCETGKGIDELSDEIMRAAADMEQMGRGWPETYQNAEKAIEVMREEDARVSRDKLYEIFEKSGIDKEGFENAAEQMETLGLITQFRDSLELEDFVVLNPQWLTKGISLVMEDKKLDTEKGEITQERMKEIWDEGYSGLYMTLHSCMKEFELLYDMEDMAGCLVPLRFGDVRPEIPWSEIPSAKERRIESLLSGCLIWKTS